MPHRLVSVPLALAALACAPSPPDCRDVLSQLLVVSTWRHDGSTDDRFLPGADLDHTVSEGLDFGCTAAFDFTSPVSGTPGVDNQFGANVVPLLAGMLTEGDLAASIHRQLLRGEHLLGVEIGRGASGITAAVLVLSATAPVRADVSGTALEAGQTFVVVDRLEGLPVCLGAGELGLVLSSLEVPLGEELGSARLDDVRLRILFGPEGVRAAELGGSLTVAELVATFRRLGVGIDEATIRSVTQPDLSPRSLDVCDAVSFGVALDLVPAEIL